MTQFAYPKRFEVAGQPGRQGHGLPRTQEESRRYRAAAGWEFLLTVDVDGTNATLHARPAGKRNYNWCMGVGRFRGTPEQILSAAVADANTMVDEFELTGDRPAGSPQSIASGACGHYASTPVTVSAI